MSHPAWTTALFHENPLSAVLLRECPNRSRSCKNRPSFCYNTWLPSVIPTDLQKCMHCWSSGLWVLPPVNQEYVLSSSDRMLFQLFQLVDLLLPTLQYPHTEIFRKVPGMEAEVLFLIWPLGNQFTQELSSEVSLLALKSACNLKLFFHRGCCIY